ncbi:hypothetical protein T11_17861 [Trichinella zimbabwensis]|uniref:Uncharacterized protein n=1 Tax=Trichinella zimbabwensis TaxID=268475 RepID=A0A0V1GTA1_9BILA|nr:hypothetical protein T11_7722 [Trichinella zimbabwensis]KRZ01378.1 hypothetical protein T11_17861 [Trichinella zimbabwensis]
MAEVVGRQMNPTETGVIAKESRKDRIISSIIPYIKEGRRIPKNYDWMPFPCSGNRWPRKSVRTSDQFDSPWAFRSTTDEAVRSFSGFEQNTRSSRRNLQIILGCCQRNLGAAYTLMVWSRCSHCNDHCRTAAFLIAGPAEVDAEPRQ